MNHTSGPWISRTDYNTDETFIETRDGIQLAKVYHHPEYEETATLMVAALELLETLKRCHHRISMHKFNLTQSGLVSGMMIDEWTNFLKDIESVIAKAEGKD